MGPQLFGAAGGGGVSQRKIGDLVYKHVSAPQEELAGLVRANGRVLPVEGNEDLADMIGAEFGLPATDFERVSSGNSCFAIIYFNGYWYAYVGILGILRSQTGQAGSWAVVSTITTASTPIGSSVEFAILNNKLYFFAIMPTANALLYETTDGVTWTTYGAANKYAGLGLSNPITNGGAVRMRAINGKLVFFGGHSSAAYIVWTEDVGVTFTVSNSAIASRVNDMVDSNGTVVSVHNGGGIQTCANIVASNGWTSRASGVTEALNVIVTTADGVTRIIGASGRTLTSADQINFTPAQSIDGVTSPVRMVHMSGMDVMLASSSALDNNRRINVSMDFNSWRSEKVDGQTMMTTFYALATDGSKIAIGGSSGIDMTSALSFDPATEFWVPNFEPGGDMRAYFVAVE